uniref:Nucleoporin NUP42 n=1 Tax=Denticeps clupeoides TaxID=299321 RepID=A0AAY4DAH0_9TELE
MTVCNFFLQGRCRYGEKCWNEHPRGGGGTSGGGGGGRSGGSGFGNRVWVNPNQRSAGNYVQPPAFSRGGNDWAGGGRDTKSSDFSFSARNRFGALASQTDFDQGGQKDENEKHIETIQSDMEIWENSGQWVFSCYSVLKSPITGFVDLSPEELRLEYYSCKATGDMQTYGNSVQQLVGQWRGRVQELKLMSSSTRAAVLLELNNQSSQTSSFGPSGFGSSFGFVSASSGFGSNSFSFTSPSAGFGLGGSSAFNSATSTQPQPVFGSAPPSSAPTAASFSFAAPAVSKNAPSAFGEAPAPTAAGFSFASSTAGSFGSGFGSTSTPSPGGFGMPGGSSVATAGGFGSVAAATVSAPATRAAVNLFTPRSELSPEELKEFEASRFTLGQIPLRPPPADLLVV